MRRDDIEAVLRGWDTLERSLGGSPIIDFDCGAVERSVKFGDRVEVLETLTGHRETTDDDWLLSRVEADIAYVEALLGKPSDLAEYIQRTQGCIPVGWNDDYLADRRDQAKEGLRSLGIAWDGNTLSALREVEGIVGLAEIVNLIQQEVDRFEVKVRQCGDVDADFSYDVETVDLDEYWSYWVDGTGGQARLRLNLRNADFTYVEAARFALHEILGHVLQAASFAQNVRTKAVPWVRILSVHAPHQVMLEGLAQALPLFVAPDQEELCCRVRLTHYIELVKAKLHIAANSGLSGQDLTSIARQLVPFWSETHVAAILKDRQNDPLLRSYLWSYPAGLDWFVNLAESGEPDVTKDVLHASYNQPLTPRLLSELWTDGPNIGGH